MASKFKPLEMECKFLDRVRSFLLSFFEKKHVVHLKKGSRRGESYFGTLFSKFPDWKWFNGNSNESSTIQLWDALLCPDSQLLFWKDLFFLLLLSCRQPFVLAFESMRASAATAAATQDAHCTHCSFTRNSIMMSIWCLLHQKTNPVQGVICLLFPQSIPTDSIFSISVVKSTIGM